MSPRRANPLSIEYVLLGILHRQPRYGYIIHKEISQLEGIGLIWQVKQSQLYALLDKLEKQGLLTSVIIPTENHPYRKLFEITPAGLELFSEWVVSPVVHMRDLRQELLARLYFAMQIGGEAPVRLLKRQQRLCVSWLEAMQSSQKDLTDAQAYEKMVTSFRIRQVKATLEWLDEALAQFADISQSSHSG